MTDDLRDLEHLTLRDASYMVLALAAISRQMKKEIRRTKTVTTEMREKRWKARRARENRREWEEARERSFEHQRLLFRPVRRPSVTQQMTHPEAPEEWVRDWTRYGILLAADRRKLSTRLAVAIAYRPVKRNDPTRRLVR